MKLVVGVDIGGTDIKAGIVDIDKDAKILKKVKIETEAKKGRKKVLSNIIKTIDGVITKDAAYIGIGVPGPFKDMKRGILARQNNLPLENVNLVKELEKEFKIPVRINNDANCFVLAEAVYGAGKDNDIVAGLTLGTGIGSGLVISRRIYSGRGNAFEFGNTRIEGKKTIEDLSGKKGLMEIAKKKGLDVKDPLQIFNLAEKGNKKAILVWNEFGENLGVACSNLIQTVDPEVIVIGGKIAGAWKFFNKAMKKKTKELCMFEPCPIVKSYVEDAGIIGASLL